MKIVQIGMGVCGEKYSKILSDLGVLAGVCDSNSQKSKEFGDKYFVNHYDSVDNLIASEIFDGVFVDTDVSSGLEIVTKILDEKKHLFVENTVMFDSIESEKLKEISQKNNIVFTGRFDERFNPTTKQVKKFVKGKKYGELIFLEFYSEGKLSSKNSKGVIFENSIKDIDIANWLFDEMPLVVFARSGTVNNENGDFASIILGYKDNKTAIISSNGFSSKKVREFRAICSEGVIFVDLISSKIKLEKEDSQVFFGGKDSILLQIQNFIEVIEGKNELDVKPQDSVNLLKIAEAALLSGKQGVPIYLDLK
jgi:UDP-N-acetylglucosamine 3-dehydrogenase